jgi:hypothetical protein
MKHPKSWRRTITLVLAIAIGPALAGSAWAWFEGATATASYLADVGAGCIQIYNQVIHSDGSSRMTVTPHLIPKGSAKQDDVFCKAIPGTFSYIAGNASTFLFKLTRDDPTKDVYSLCQFMPMSSNAWVGELTTSATWPTPPCGPGYYVAVTCTAHVTTFVTDWQFYFTGEFNQPALKNCHHSRQWHPAMTGGLNLTVNL